MLSTFCVEPPRKKTSDRRNEDTRLDESGSRLVFVSCAASSENSSGPMPCNFAFVSFLRRDRTLVTHRYEVLVLQGDREGWPAN